MRFQEANRRHQSIISDLIEVLLQLLAPFRRNDLTPGEWDAMLATIYPRVEEARWESASLARSVYDYERRKHIGETADAWLAHYELEWFLEAMEPARAAFSDEFASEDAMAEVILHITKVVEDGWRKTLIRAVQDDPLNQDDDDDQARVIDNRPDLDEETEEAVADVSEIRRRPRRVVRWARVATGRETCGFCMMLVSRGPVYQSAETAGLNASDEKAIDLLDRGDEAALDALMSRWHEGCDCRVVPVFDLKDWPGRDEYLRAEKLWQRVTKGAEDNRDAINRFRRAIEHGELDLEELQEVAAAA